ncbi:MAG: hypothetical protein EOO67_01035 [Microbacterium sp.]|nr:MAG: hypothetical protein EOO67_01035 [Microbacterium sp.]
MDELWSRVRDLAPDLEASAADTDAARVALHAAIAAEPPHRAHRSPRARAFAGGRWSLPSGMLAAVAAVVVVAVIAAGAIVASQWLSQPAPQIAHDWAQVDLHRPLLDQADQGEYVRVATITQAPSTFEGEGTDFSEDSYVVLRTVSSVYLSDHATWMSVLGEEPQRIVRTVGRDGEAMAELVNVDEPPSVLEADTPAAGWRQSLPGDAEGLIEALAERQGTLPPESLKEAQDRFWFMYLADPAWYAFTTDQRRAVLEYIADGPDTQRTVREDGSWEMSYAIGGGTATTVFDPVAMLPMSGSSTGGLFGPVADGSDDLAARWRTEISIVDGAPEAVIPDEPATFSCNGVPIPGSYAHYDGLTEMLDDNGRAALEADGVPGLDPEEWAVVSQSPERVVLWSWVIHQEQLSQGDLPSGIPALTHELLTIENDGEEWSLTGWAGCVLKQVLPDHDVADVELDPAFAVTASTTQLHFLVTELGCSPTPLEGRVELLDLQEFAGEGVEVLLGIRPAPSDGATCDTPQTAAFAVDLSEPIGDGFIGDRTYMEPRLLHGEPTPER